jgi:oxygen-independent coproporphyrinogen-3 oxidase
MEFPSEKKVAMAIEIDPRTISCRDDLQKLRDLGFNRISLGVQDFDENVQYAIGRIQPKELVERVLSWARSVGFDGINMDLIYGLPCQSVSSFSRTLDAVMQMEPDRIALFSFAYVPQIRSHQFGISTDNLPSLEEKAQIFVYAKERIQLSGYLSIGMDHFCKPHDSLAVAYMNRTLTRNFQGYDLGLCKTIVGFGMSSISAFQEGYFQNTKTLEEYQNLIDHEQLPSIQGYIFSEEDKIRKWVISEIMCWCEVDKKAFFENFSCDFDDVFQEELGELYRKIPGSFFENQEKILKITSSGKFFLRMISSIFDGEFKNAL